MTVTILRMADLLYRHGQYNRQGTVTPIIKTIEDS